MKRNTNGGLYVGLLLILVGIVFLLDLNGILPDDMMSEYVNFIVAFLCLVGFVNSKKLITLMGATFFITNGAIILADRYIDAWIYLSGIMLIPAMMFLVAFVVRKNIGYLIPGAMLSSWGMYMLLMIAGVFSGFTTIIGMGFIFTAIGFLVIFIYVQEMWAGVPSFVIGVIGIIVATLGFGETARFILFNVLTIAAIVLGLLLVIRSMFKNKEID